MTRTTRSSGVVSADVPRSAVSEIGTGTGIHNLAQEPMQILVFDASTHEPNKSDSTTALSDNKVYQVSIPPSLKST